MQQDRPQSLVAVPAATIDFGGRADGDEDPRNDYGALVMLRRQLGRHKLRFPIYDFALYWYLRRARNMSREQLLSFPLDEETDMLAPLVDMVIQGIPLGSLIKSGVNVALKWIDKAKGDDLSLWWQRRGIDPDTIDGVMRGDVFKDLRPRLPELFARDLDVLMQGEKPPRRVVLFFDTHEAIRGLERNLAGDQAYRGDEWLRQLVGTLRLGRGIVVVVAGRDPLRWSDPGIS